MIQRPIITTTTAPTVEPVTVSEIKDHLRIEHSEHDTMLESLIKASRQWMEAVTGRAFVQRTLAVSYQEWPKWRFQLPYPPAVSVDSIKYTGTDGTEYTLDSDIYDTVLDQEPAEIVLGYNKVWPSTVLHHESYPITITYTAGYPATDDSPPDYAANVPESIKNAIKLDVELRYDRPTEKYSERLEQVVMSLISPYRAWWA